MKYSISEESCCLFVVTSVYELRHMTCVKCVISPMILKSYVHMQKNQSDRDGLNFAVTGEWVCAGFSLAANCGTLCYNDLYTLY